jgi:hypothetical protein
MYTMKSIKWILAVAITALFFSAASGFAQQAGAEPPTKSATPAPTAAATNAATPASTDAQESNIRAYVELLRADVKAKKTQILSELMQLNDDQAEKFWPVYREYDLELQALNDRKLAGIQFYAKNYQSMTDEKADELATGALELENKRNDLKKKYYEKMREQLGGIIAARFLQIENQLLMVVDLQIASLLPIVEK